VYIKFGETHRLLIGVPNECFRLKANNDWRNVGQPSSCNASQLPS